ncbi:efflux RND transporter periplasmic adaptor subunit [Sphingomonas sp. 22176]|uniref:efflux RND transporter periplasmic adaptor subunit n=1 Tax=Sphingomonas sp. 22176 TaxID=3453884 RepID=UPI003F840BEA
MESNTLPEARRLTRRSQGVVVAAIVLVVVALLVLATLVEAMLTPKPVQEAPLPPGAFRPTPQQLAQMQFATVQGGANVELVRASGSIQADGDHSTPIVLPFSGQVLQVLVEPGQRVTRGQPLLRIASPELIDARNTLLAASAQRASAAEALRIAQGNVTRQKAITETAGGAMKDYLQAQADFVAAQSAARQAESAQRAAQDRLALFGKTEGVGTSAYTVYRAPVSGIIADRNVAPGQFLSSGNATPVMTITDPARVWLVAQLAESEAASIRVGDQVVVTTPALPGREFTATVDNVAAGLDPTTHRLPVRATIANPGGELKPQMFAAFTIRRPVDTGKGVLVPAVAVIHEGDTARVWVKAKDGLIYGRPVQIGESDGGLTRVLSGLNPGDRIVAKGALFVNEAGLGE